MERLKHEAEATVAHLGEAVDVEAGHVLVVEEIAAGARRVEASDHLQQRRLAGAGGAEHGDVLAALKRAVHFP